RTTSSRADRDEGVRDERRRRRGSGCSESRRRRVEPPITKRAVRRDRTRSVHAALVLRKRIHTRKLASCNVIAQWARGAGESCEDRLPGPVRKTWTCPTFAQLPDVTGPRWTDYEIAGANTAWRGETVPTPQPQRRLPGIRVPT